MQSGDKVANFSVATSERWKDRNSGEMQERTEWHRVVIFGRNRRNRPSNICGRARRSISRASSRPGSGRTTRPRQERYTTEVVIRPYRGEMTMLDSRRDGGRA